MKLSRHLVSMTLWTVAPLLLFVLGGVALFLVQETNTYRDGAINRVRALSTAVDAELRSIAAPLETLATSSRFDAGDLRAIEDDVARVIGAVPAWRSVHIYALANDAEALVGRPLDAATLRHITEAARTASDASAALEFSNAMTRADDGEIVFTVRLKVLREGALRYVLTGVIETSAFDRLIAEQGIPDHWATGIVDSDHNFIARRPLRPQSNRASSSLQRMLAPGSEEGWERGVTLEGVDTFTAFHRSNYSGWVTAAAIPAAVVQKNATRTAYIFASSALLAVVTALALAWRANRRITAPLSKLIEAVPSVGGGGAGVVLPATNIFEVRQLASALQAADRDIHERQLAQRQAEEALRSAARGKDEFLAMLAHELRNPLAAMSSAVHVLKYGANEAATVTRVQELMDRQVKHMSHLVDDLLEVGRVTSGKVALKREDVDIAALIAKLISEWRRGARAGMERVTTQLTPVWVNVDPVRIEQVVGNLLDNALKFTPESGSICVSSSLEAGHAVVSITDTGTGMHPDEVDRLFDLFAQGGSSLAREQGGLGIGLTLARRLAELHGGSLHGCSAGPGAGSTFTLRLPATEAPVQEVQITAAAPPDAQSKRVLLVEDNTDSAAALTMALTTFGHRVFCASTGEEGLRMAREVLPDVALIDIGLPAIDGYQVAAGLRADPACSDIRLIALTGYGSSNDRQLALRAGFDLHLTKPVNVERLQALLVAAPGA